MDPFYPMMTMADVPEEKIRALAKTLAQRSIHGAGLAVTDIPEIAAQGRLMQTDSHQAALNTGLQAARRSAEETDRLKAHALSKSVGFVKPSNTSLAKFEEDANLTGNALNLVERWDPSFASTLPGPLGELENTVTRSVKGFFGNQAQAEWWSDFKDQWENIRRHALFGSALTASEKVEWRKAQPNPGDSQEFIASKLQTLRRLQLKLAAQSVLNASNKGWDSQYLYDQYSNVLPPEFWSDPRGFIKGKNLDLKDTDLNQLQQQQQLKNLSLEELYMLKETFD